MFSRQVAKSLTRAAPTKLASSRLLTRGYAVIKAETVSDITAQEKQITGLNTAVRRGPTSIAQKYLGRELTEEILQEIQEAANRLAAEGTRGQGNAQNQSQNRNQSNQSLNTQNIQGQPNNQGQSVKTSTPPSVNMDGTTIQKIAQSEMQLTGENQPVQGGPTAHAQAHANEPITSQVLHDITEGEKTITGGQRVAGGPTSTAQSALGKGLNAQGRNSVGQNSNTNNNTNNNNNANTLNNATNANGTPNINNSATSTVLGRQQNNNNQTPNLSGGANVNTNLNSNTSFNQRNNNNNNNNNRSNLNANTGATPIMDSAVLSKIAQAETNITGDVNPAPAGPTARAQAHEGEPITSQVLHDITEGEKGVTGANSAIKGGPTSAAQSEIGKARNN